MQVSLIARMDGVNGFGRSYTWEVEGISRACANQLVRHRLGSFSQESQRYVDSRTDFDYVTPPAVADHPAARVIFDRMMDYAYECYSVLREMGIRKEDARFVLPVAATTKIVITLSDEGLDHFFWQRLDKASQWEIRQMAERMAASIGWKHDDHQH